MIENLTKKMRQGEIERGIKTEETKGGMTVGTGLKDVGEEILWRGNEDWIGVETEIVEGETVTEGVEQLLMIGTAVIGLRLEGLVPANGVTGRKKMIETEKTRSLEMVRAKMEDILEKKKKKKKWGSVEEGSELTEIGSHYFLILPRSNLCPNSSLVHRALVLVLQVALVRDLDHRKQTEMIWVCRDLHQPWALLWEETFHPWAGTSHPWVIFFLWETFHKEVIFNHQGAISLHLGVISVESSSHQEVISLQEVSSVGP